jgi:hypothetical protein
MTKRLLVWVVGTMLLGACEDDDEPAIDASTVDAIEEPDATEGPDAAGPDAAAPDASEPDADLPDAGDPDAGDIDGGGDDLDCSEFVACGGDPTGTWSFDGVCDFELPLDVCPEATVNSLVNDLSGTLELASDQAYSLEVSFVQQVNVSFPPACAGEGSDSCADYQQPGLTCSGDPAVSCVCEGQISTPANAKSGTWTVRGNLLSLSEGKSTDELEFCVSGSQLRIHEPGFPGVIVLRK